MESEYLKIDLYMSTLWTYQSLADMMRKIALKIIYHLLNIDKNLGYDYFKRKGCFFRFQSFLDASCKTIMLIKEFSNCPFWK